MCIAADRASVTSIGVPQCNAALIVLSCGGRIEVQRRLISEQSQRLHGLKHTLKQHMTLGFKESMRANNSKRTSFCTIRSSIYPDGACLEMRLCARCVQHPRLISCRDRCRAPSPDQRRCRVRARCLGHPCPCRCPQQPGGDEQRVSTHIVR